MEDEVLTPQEAAEFLKVGLTTLQAMVCKNTVPYRKLDARGKGRQYRIRFSRQALVEWLKGDEPQKLELVKPKGVSKNGKRSG